MSLFSRLNTHLEAHADGAGPVRGTLSLPRMAFIWLAANFVVTTLLTGTFFIPAIGFGAAVTLIVVGTIAGAVVLVLVGYIGTRTGLPTMALTRGAFGIRGSLLPAYANIVSLMGWVCVQAMLAGITVDYVVQTYTGYSNPVLFAALSQAIAVVLAIFGHEGIARVEPWLAVVMVGFAAWIFTTAFAAFPPAAYLAIPVDETLGLTPAIVLDLVISTAIAWTVLAADINRHARDGRASILGSGVGYTISTVIAMLLGATATGYLVLQGETPLPFDPAPIVAAFGVPLAAVIFLSVMATNVVALYGITTSAINAAPRGRLRFLPAVLVLGAISIAGSTWLGLLSQFTTFLTMIGGFFVPVFAIMIVDYFFIKRRNYTADMLRSGSGRYWYRGGVNMIAIGCWALGALVSYLLAYVLHSPTGATIPAFVLTFVVYLVAMLPERRRGEVAPYAHLGDAGSAEPAPAVATGERA
ncbi:cytosine permease [Streptomyces sp. AC495_CC817]|uniref:purine-cytosine permease family protein n=1 Tax=Streptomyces sp. AC495_CC817 TaxID=2823900 RepID=UPI001C25FA6D|nr:cytosine permease [Streptomyces sp. AC495_CC817]